MQTCSASIMDGCVIIALHHGGVFVNDPVSGYVGGNIEYTPDMDTDFLSVPHIVKTAGSLGYMNIKNLWYWLPRTKFSEGVRILQTDRDLLDMVSSLGPMDKVLHIYIEHGIDDPSSQVINPPLLIESVHEEPLERPNVDDHVDLDDQNLGGGVESQQNR